MKQLKQMDHFEHAFIATYHAIKREEIYRDALEITPEEGAFLTLKICVMRYMSYKELPIHHEIIGIKETMSQYLTNWLPGSRLADLNDEFRMLLREGTQAKLKMPVLGQVFHDCFNQIFDLIAVVHGGYFEEHSNEVQKEREGDLQAIEVFRNKGDTVRHFVLNKHEGKGLECIVLFKKLIKKFELCENLAKRERTKDGFGLLVDDGGYTNLSHADPATYLRD